MKDFAMEYPIITLIIVLIITTGIVEIIQALAAR